MTELNNGHLDMAEEIQKALRKWCQYRLDNNTPSEQVKKEVYQATDLIVNHILNPRCNCEDTEHSEGKA